MDRLARKVDDFLVDWKNSPNHLPLIIKGHGKSEKQKPSNIFPVPTMTMLQKSTSAGSTLLFFNELHTCPNCATSLKAF